MFSDDLLQFQSYLSGKLRVGTGEITRNSPVLDINPVWRDYRGDGVSASFDLPIDRTHPDLRANYDGRASPSNPLPLIREIGNSQTGAASALAADDNGRGLVGVAPDASIHGTQLEPGAFGDVHVPLAAQSTPYMEEDRDWFDADARGGRGTVTVTNTPEIPDFEGWAQSEFVMHSDRAVITVKALTAAGFVHAGRDSEGDMTLVGAPVFTDSYFPPGVATGRDLDNDGFIDPGTSVINPNVAADAGLTLLADDTGAKGFNAGGDTIGGLWQTLAERQLDVSINSANYFGDSTGSAASAVAGGVATLMLDANPDLGWRDVQEILAYSADWTMLPDGPTVDAEAGEAPTWTVNGASDWNGGGLAHDPDHGFGAIDVRGAVRLAESWAGSATSANEITRSVTPQGGLPDWPALDADQGLFVAEDTPATQSVDFRSNSDMRIEHVSVHMTYEATPGEFYSLSGNNPADRIDWTLTSPSEVTSELAVNHGVFDSEGYPVFTEIDHTFTSRVFWGENPSAGDGVWTLSATVGTNAGTTIDFSELELRFHGDRPSEDDTYVFTDSFRAARRLDNEHGPRLDDGEGSNTINAAAMTRDLDLTAVPGEAARAGGGRLYTLGQGDDVDALIAGDGNDQLVGTGGEERLVGGRGADVMRGRGGDDAIYAGPNENGGDRLFGGGGRDVLGGGGGRDRLEGGGGADTLFGGAGRDRLAGDDGADTVWAGGGDDRVFGGAGSDTLGGGAGGDRIAAGGGGDILYAGPGRGGDRLTAGAGEDIVFAGGGEDTLRGQGGDDTLYNGAGTDAVGGGGGADTLWGGPGNDRLTGGGGADTFAFARGNGADVVTDFDTGTDTVEIGRGAARFRDLDIGRAEGAATVAFADTTITLASVDAGALEADMFSF